MVGKLMPQMSPEEALVKTGSLIKRISATPRYWSEKYTDSCELSEFLSELGRPLKKGRQEIIVDKLLKIEERVLAGEQADDAVRKNPPTRTYVERTPK